MSKHSAEDRPDGLPASRLAPRPVGLEVALVPDSSLADPAAIPETQPIAVMRLRRVPDLPVTQPMLAARPRRIHAEWRRRG